LKCHHVLWILENCLYNYTKCKQPYTRDFFHDYFTLLRNVKRVLTIVILCMFPTFTVYLFLHSTTYASYIHYVKHI